YSELRPVMRTGLARPELRIGCLQHMAAIVSVRDLGEKCSHIADNEAVDRCKLCEFLLHICIQLGPDFPEPCDTIRKVLRLVRSRCGLLDELVSPVVHSGGDKTKRRNLPEEFQQQSVVF